MAGGIADVESTLLVLLPLSFSNEAEALLGRTPGMGPSAYLRDMVLKVRSAGSNSTSMGKQGFILKLELALGHGHTAQLKLADSRGTPPLCLSSPGFR